MNPGASPRGVSGDDHIARWVRRMFDSVAPRYDLLNHLLSFNIDRWWRRRAVRLLLPILSRPSARVLDLCCGSGDLLIALQRRAPSPVWGCDFSHSMLLAARRKTARRRLPAQVFEADALRLPLSDASLDLVTAAFGFRNLANYRRGLAEILRVLAPGGAAAILEFSTPPHPVFRTLYRVYSTRILPRVGAAISGSPDAYSYLPESVRLFPGAEDLAREMRDAGFRRVTFSRMTFGIVALHIGER